MEDNLWFNGKEGMLIFSGVINFSIEPEPASEAIDFEILNSDCLNNGQKDGLLLWGILWLNYATREKDYPTFRVFADYATWYPKTNPEEPKNNN